MSGCERAYAGLLLLTVGCAHPAAPLLPPGQLLSEVTFTAPSALASNEEIGRRLFTPLTLKRGLEAAAAKGLTLQEQALDLASERFVVYLPAGPAPAAGYGLLVFVAPWNEPTEPDQWKAALDRRGVIFVCAVNSGNNHQVYGRRLPLALHAYQNLIARYQIDPNRVYIGGLSGGSRVAEVTAMGYPDVFRGALLNAGSDPVGVDGLPPPRAELFAKFQAMRIVYVTGSLDELNLRTDQVSRNSMRDWCVLNLETRTAPNLGHGELDAISFGRALEALEDPGAVDAGKLAGCNARLRQRLGARVAEVEAALARGDRRSARSLLAAIDGEFGGVAARESLELEEAVRAQ
jgi:hypothetical protein